MGASYNARMAKHRAARAAKHAERFAALFASPSLEDVAAAVGTLVEQIVAEGQERIDRIIASGREPTPEELGRLIQLGLGGLQTLKLQERVTGRSPEGPDQSPPVTE